jgi:hypothetical protein
LRHYKVINLAQSEGYLEIKKGFGWHGSKSQSVFLTPQKSERGRIQF